MNLRKICIITGTRAEYGQLKGLIGHLQNYKAFELDLVVTGSHLSSEYGSTFLQIKNDGFNISKKIEMLLSSDSPTGVCKSLNLLSLSLSEHFQIYRPDLLIILGDRYEVFGSIYSINF